MFLFILVLSNSRFLTPYAAPSTGVFIGNSPLGVRQGCRTLPKGQESLLATPDKNAGAQEASGIRAGFLLNAFLCPSKEKYFAFGCENPIKTIVALATQLVKLHSHIHE
jgi:hypothetical protein